MINFEKITETPEALGEFLASLSVATGPWDEEFHRMFCDSCKRENCDGKRCPHQDKRNNLLWWLMLGGKEGEVPGLTVRIKAAFPILWDREYYTVAEKKKETRAPCVCCDNTGKVTINDGVFLRVTNKSLPMGGKRKTEYKKVQAARAQKGDSIEDRPEEVATREEPFHWEMDSVLSAKEGNSKKRFLTMTERKSRADLMFLMPDGTMASVVAVLDMLETKLGTVNFRRIFQSITVDNGSEFQDWEGMMRAATDGGDRTHIYYCHPYSAFERGSNENGNRMIRRRVPKGTDFTGITEADTLEVQRWVNEYPRGILGGKCAGRVLMELAKEAGVEGIELIL